MRGSVLRWGCSLLPPQRTAQPTVFAGGGEVGKKELLTLMFVLMPYFPPISPSFNLKNGLFGCCSR